MATVDFLDEKRSEIGARLKELKPLVEEYQRLEAPAAALGRRPATALMQRRDGLMVDLVAQDRARRPLGVVGVGHRRRCARQRRR
jgi:hypothetical protein